VLAAGANADTTHTFVAWLRIRAPRRRCRCTRCSALTFPAPAVGTSGVLQSTAYTIRLTFGTTTCTYDIHRRRADDRSAPAWSVATPKPADDSTPQTGDLYFGSFIGGATSITAWSVPVFLAVTPAEVAGAGFNGTMTLGAQVSGLPVTI